MRSESTALDAADSGPVPTEFVADTVKVYAEPLFSPVTTADVGAGDPVTAVGGLCDAVEVRA